VSEREAGWRIPHPTAVLVHRSSPRVPPSVRSVVSARILDRREGNGVGPPRERANTEIRTALLSPWADGEVRVVVPGVGADVDEVLQGRPIQPLKSRRGVRAACRRGWRRTVPCPFVSPRSGRGRVATLMGRSSDTAPSGYAIRRTAIWRVQIPPSTARKTMQRS
jgi:hypothetical protein